MSPHLLKSILIVEDNAGDQLLLTEFLKVSGVAVKNMIYAASVYEAIKCVSSHTPDIILLDLSLPDSSGIETFFSMRDVANEIPIVILSGYADQELALRAISAGAQDYLLKDNFDERLLGKTIIYSIERKRNLEALRISNERYNLISKATNDMIWDWDLKTGKLFKNDEQFNRIFQLLESQIIYSADFWLSRIHPDDRAAVQYLIEKIFDDNTQSSFETEFRFLRGDGNYIYLEHRGFIIRDEAGRPTRIVGALRDVTEKKNTEENINKLSLIAKETINGVVITDAHGNIEWVNEAFSKISGYSLSEVVGRKPGSFLQGPGTDAMKVAYMRKCIGNATPFEVEITNYSKQGREYWVKLSVQPIFDLQGKVVQFFAIQTDITAQKLAVEALQKSEERYRYLFNNSPASIVIWYLDDFQIAEVNDTFIKHYGYEKEEIAKLSVFDLRPPSDYSLIRDFARDAVREDFSKATRTWRHLHKDGHEMFMEITSTRIEYKGRKAILALQINVSEKLALAKKLEEERMEKQQHITQAVITALERERAHLGRELHDNVNQVLASSRLYLGLVKSEMQNPKYINKADELINSAVEEIRNLSHSLTPPSLGRHHFVEALNNIVDTTMLGTNLHITKEMEDFDSTSVPDNILLTIYRIVQEQFNNILKHANAKNVLLRLTSLNNKVTLVIKDDGKGFDPAEISFGLGLMNIRTRTSLHKGEMNVYTEPGKGCELVVQIDYL